MARLDPHGRSTALVAAVAAAGVRPATTGCTLTIFSLSLALLLPPASHHLLLHLHHLITVPLPRCGPTHSSNKPPGTRDHHRRVHLRRAAVVRPANGPLDGRGPQPARRTALGPIEAMNGFVAVLTGSYPRSPSLGQSVRADSLHNLRLFLSTLDQATTVRQLQNEIPKMFRGHNTRTE